jgi:tetratricopeptide (TPR) repeat protein
MEQYYRTIARRLIYPTICLFFAFAGVVNAQQHSIQEILVLLERGQFSSASDMLQTNLQLDPADSESRILLGSLMEHSGLRMEAIRLWQKGLRNDESDYPLLMSIGESYLNEAQIQAQEDSTPSSLLPVNSAPTEYLTYLDSAIINFRQAAAYYPHEADPLHFMLNAYQLKADYEQALYYANLLVRIFPSDENNHTLLGLLLMQTGNYQQAETSLRKSLALNPRYTPAQKGMAELMLFYDRTEDAALFMRQAAFYDFIPSFARLTFHANNYEIYSRLTNAAGTENEDELRRIFLSLLDDKSDESTQWIATMFWHQLVPADLDEIGWDEFTLRDAESKRLIMEMAQRTENWILLGRLCKKMVQLHIPGTFELLTNLLPKDKMMDSPLRIAYCLAALGDELAIPYLVRELQYDDTDDDNDGYHFSKEGRQAARQRAVLALSYFNTTTAIETLQKGLQNSEIKPYCAAALYRLTMEEKYLEPLRQMAYSSKKDIEIAHFLRFIGTHEADRIARLME